MTDIWEDGDDLDELPDVNWICFDCGEINPIKKARCKECGKEKQED